MMNDGADYREEITLSVEKLTRFTFLSLPLISLAFLIPYFLLRYDEFARWIDAMTGGTDGLRRWLAVTGYLAKKSLLWLVYVVAGILLHELLHGIGWVIFGGKSFRSLQFGVLWKYLSPYAHCKEPVKVRGYRAGIILPGVIVGILPGIYGIVAGQFGWVLFGIIFTWGAIADFVMWWILRKLPPDSQVIDHPEKVGCYVLKKDQSEPANPVS